MQCDGEGILFYISSERVAEVLPKGVRAFDHVQSLWTKDRSSV